MVWEKASLTYLLKILGVQSSMKNTQETNLTFEICNKILYIFWLEILYQI